MDERAEKRLARQLDQVPAGLAQSRPLAQHLADPEAPAEQAVELDAARGDVAPRLAGGEVERVDDLCLDQRQGAADPVVVVVTEARGVAVSLESDTGEGADLLDRAHGLCGRRRDVNRLYE